jgi:superfamily II RNA helicase
MKETIALLKEQKGELKKKVSKLESNENAVSTLELHQKKKELDVEAHLQKKRNEQLMKEQERESKKKEKSARMSLTSTMAGMAPSGTWNDIVVSYVYNSFLLNVILIL